MNANDVKTVKFMLETGANPSFRLDPRHDTPLHRAVHGNQTRIVGMLLEAGANVDAVSYFSGSTPLHNAMEYKNEEIVRILLEAGSDVSAKDRGGSTAFSLGIKYETTLSAAMLKMFLATNVIVKYMPRLATRILSELVCANVRAGLNYHSELQTNGQTDRHLASGSNRQHFSFSIETSYDNSETK